MFISIRWKAAILLSLILLFITLGWVVRSIYFDLESYQTDIKEDQVRFQNTLDQLISDNFLKLSQYAQLIGGYPYIKQANSVEDTTQFQQRLASKWFDLNLNIGVDYIAVIDPQNNDVLSSHRLDDSIALQRFKSSIRLFSSNTNDKKINNFVYCDIECFQVVTEPFFFVDGKPGYIVIRQNMSELVARFHSISVSKVAVLIHRPKLPNNKTYIGDWKAQLWAASDFEQTYDLLQNYSQHHRDLQSIYFEDSLWNMLSSDYRINRLLPQNYIQVGHPAVYVNIIDNSDQKALVKANVTNQILSGVVAWVFAVLIMTIALMGPIERILKVVKAMSFLPRQQFIEAKQVIGPRPKSTRDEISELEGSTLVLADKLKDLQTEVDLSNERLQDQVLTVTRSKEFLQRLFDNANLFIVTQNNFFGFNQSNAFFDEFFKKRADSFVDLLIDDIEKGDLVSQSSSLFAGKIDSYQQEVFMKTTSGDTVIVAWTHTLVENERGEREILSIGIDVTQRKQDEHALQWLANNDSLTQIGNRRVFHNALEKMLAKDQQGAVVFIDVNRFKQINDIYGHTVGDQVLIDIADILKSQVRDDDLVCRMAGDEFTLILNGVERTSLQRILSQLAKHLSGTLKLDDGRKLDYSASLGAALFPEHGNDEQTLIVHSDMAMYQAKKKGLNNWHIFDFADDSLQELKNEHHLMGVIRRALKEDLFKLYFQPILDVNSQKISHYEVLLRLKDEEGDSISPSLFIPVAERVGLINELDTWVVNHIFAKVTHLSPQFKDKLKFAINISAPSLQDQYFASKLFKISEKYHIPPQMIIVELTETAYIDNLAQVLANLNFLNEKGFDIALDDFGVGFSSFSYMKQLPLTYVKLDGSYVKDLATNEKNKAFIESVVILAKAFDMKTIAEFVQDRNTLLELKEIGVDYAQGYFLGRAKPQILNEDDIQELQDKINLS